MTPLVCEGRLPSGSEAPQDSRACGLDGVVGSDVLRRRGKKRAITLLDACEASRDIDSKYGLQKCSCVLQCVRHGRAK
jgi:hypothetical protein